MFGQGRAEAITPNHMAALADEMKCHPADLEAIAKVESAGFGWFPDGRIKILPEPHIFYRQLPKAKRSEAQRLGLATSSFKQTKASGHYKRMKGAEPRYKLFQRMIDFDPVAAFRSISIGTYQIMGFNAETCGFTDAEDMWNHFLESEYNQLVAFKNFLLKNKLKTAIQQRDFQRVETVYNGGGLNGRYARDMRVASNNLRAGKWKRYLPGSLPAPPQNVGLAKPTGVIEDASILSTTSEKTGVGVGGVVAVVGAGVATAWQNGLWVLVSVAGAAVAVFIAIRVIRRLKR